ncbi:MAG: type II toxin-antitoxin system VapC family toxin [Verrucomicrobiae bacterium]|nr:type II toxin-antitoxin system VapC family toxin [Verrucomicrobiae bacterium]MCP5548292.1 type II toxin-antitoxin system VapC family toxin [Akkermansiaceae bacterium]
MIVVDCTVIADFFLGESAHQKAAEMLLDQDPDWISPVLWRYEFGNVLRTQVRGRRMSEDLMVRYLKAGEGLVTESVLDLDMVAVGRIANQSDLSFYDASYAWLGRERGIPFYSRDGKLWRKCPDLVTHMDSLC